MNNDIFFLGNSNHFQNKKYNQINKVKDYNIFIQKNKEFILRHFNDNLLNNYENDLLKNAFFKYIQEIQNVKNFLDELNNDEEKINHSQKEIETMDKAFLKLKKNKQQTIMDSFNNKLNNSSPQNKKITIHNQNVDKDQLNLFNHIQKITDNNTNIIEDNIKNNKTNDKNIIKSLDLTDEI